MLEAKISRNQELEPKDLKRFGHDLEALLGELNLRTGLATEPGVASYFSMLQDATAHRYPEHWKTYKADLDIDQLDHLYSQFRNLSVINFPIEEHDRARCFGTFLDDAYTSTMVTRIEEMGG